MSNYSLQKYKGTATRHSSCIRLSAGAIMRAVAGIIILPRSISMTTPNAIPTRGSLLTGKGQNGSPDRHHQKQA